MEGQPEHRSGHLNIEHEKGRTAPGIEIDVQPAISKSKGDETGHSIIEAGEDTPGEIGTDAKPSDVSPHPN